MKITFDLTLTQLEELKLDIYQRMACGTFAPFHGIDKLATDVVREATLKRQPNLSKPAGLDSVIERLIKEDIVKQAESLVGAKG